MKNYVAGLVGVAGLMAAAARADVPAVAADIAPVHSLVARVMEGVGTPDLVVRQGASPHGYSMRPSEASALERADLVVWVGPGLTPWLERSIGSLADGAEIITLMQADGVHRLPFREGAIFAAQDHDTGHDHEHDHTHDHDHDDDHTHDHDQDHSHDGVDPHMWLDPGNAARWMELIAATLSEIDPENERAYAANAEAAREELATLTDEIDATLASLDAVPYLVYHDAYRYFEERFGVSPAGAISRSDATDPGAARVAELRGLAADRDVACVFSEPQFDPALVTAVFGAEIRTAVLDPMGSGLEPGPRLYPDLLRDMAAAMADCLSPRE